MFTRCAYHPAAARIVRGYVGRLDYIVRRSLRRHKDVRLALIPRARTCGSALRAALYSPKCSRCTFIREPSAVTWRAGRARKGMRAPEFASTFETDGGETALAENTRERPLRKKRASLRAFKLYELTRMRRVNYIG